MSGHTAGPWTAKFNGATASIDARESEIPWRGLATVITEMEDCETGRIKSDPEGIANARLIAAAPVMLEALEYIAGLTGYASCDNCNDVNIAARAAIALATGASA